MSPSPAQDPDGQEIIESLEVEGFELQLDGTRRDFRHVPPNIIIYGDVYIGGGSGRPSFWRKLAVAILWIAGVTGAAAAVVGVLIGLGVIGGP